MPQLHIRMIELTVLVTILALPVLFSYRTSAAQSTERVSIIRLLSEPREYDGRVIEVAGFFVCEEEDRALYLSPDDAMNGITNGGIEVNFEGSPLTLNSLLKFNRKYVSLIGVFHAQGRSQWVMKDLMGMTVLVLTDIRSIKAPPYRIVVSPETSQQKK